jgi:hypothetical protein
MSFSGGTKNTSNTSTDTLDPQFASTLYGNVDRAESLANTPFQPYSGLQVAPFTPTQLQAQSDLGAIAQNQVGAAPLQAGIDLARGVGGYTPSSVSVQPLTGVDLSGYMNPYTDQVINSAMADLGRQQQIRDASDAATATQAGAFGGSRSAVLQNLDDDSFARTAASTLADLNQQNFAQAQGAAESDLSRAQTASQADQVAGLQGANLDLNAANALTGMGGQQLNQALQQAGALQTAGDAQQQNQQAELNAAYQQWRLAQQYPIQMQGLLNQTIGMIPKTGTTTSNGSQSQFGIKDDLTQPLKLFGSLL